MTGPILLLHRAESHQPVYVNFALVQTFEQDLTTEVLLFTMNDGTCVVVSETPAQIVERLEETDSVFVGVD